MFKTKALLVNRTYGAKVTLPPECITELRWWSYNIDQWNGKAMITPGPDVTLTTDASNSGWGATVGNLHLKGTWSSEETVMHINAINPTHNNKQIKIFKKRV